MKRILILKFPFASQFGGGERHTLTLVEGLQRKDFRFYLVASCRVLLREFKKRGWHHQRGWAGIEPVTEWALLLWPITAPFVFVYLLTVLLFYRTVRGATALYCLSLTEKVLATVPARLLGMQVVWVEHVTFGPWLTRNPLKFPYRWFSRLATVVAVSNAVREQLTRDLHVPASHAVVIYNGIDLRLFPMRTKRWEQAARYNIGCVARLDKEKGIEFLIQAIKIVREFIPFARLIIVGEGSERRKLAWLAERLNLKEYIQWIGHQREIEKWYGYFDAYVLPSVKRESFGITLVEAMASGVPVVASRLGGTPEIIDHRRTGLLARPGDSQDLADQLMYLFNNRTATHDMVLAARQKVEQLFSLDRMLRDYYLLFRK